MVSVLWALGLIVLGAIVRATGSGVECSGWPLCNGQFSPANDTAGALIFGHRLGGFVMLLLATALVGITQVKLQAHSIVHRLAAVGFVVVLAQAVLGGFAAVREMPTAAVTIHLMLALAVLAVFVVVSITIRERLNAVTGQPAAATSSDFALPEKLTGHVRVMALMLLLVLASGSIANSPEAAAVCSSPGDCLSSLRSAFGNPGGLVSAHHVLGLATLALAGVFLVDVGRLNIQNRRTRTVALAAGVTLALAMIVSGALRLFDVPAALLALPLGIAAVSWAATTALLTGSAIARPQHILPAFNTAPAKTLLRDFARVTKPGIMLLLLITTLGAMLVAAQGWPSLSLVLLTLLGGALASGGASALNCYYDRDIDVVMARTRKRPIPTGGLTSDQVRAFGLALSLLAVVVLAWFVNPLAATMALSGNLFYVLIYTRKLKRTTPQNIVIGGAAGSFPPLVGWAAVTGSLSLGAILIAAIIFYWTPPHFWSLALLKARDYQRAAIPMLPVTHGEHETRRRILLYSLLLVAVTLLMVPAGVVGAVYGVTAAVLGAWFIISAWRMFREGTSRLAWPLFKYSNYYLAALLAAMAIDHAIGF